MAKAATILSIRQVSTKVIGSDGNCAVAHSRFYVGNRDTTISCASPSTPVSRGDRDTRGSIDIRRAMPRLAQLATEQLSQAECREVLRSSRVGRLLNNAARYPRVVVVSYALVFDEVFFSWSSDRPFGQIGRLSVTFEAHADTSDRDDDRTVYLRDTLKLVDDPLEIEGLEIIAPWVYSNQSPHGTCYSIGTTYMTGVRSFASYREASRLRLV